jgi:hypothetical protein
MLAGRDVGGAALRRADAIAEQHEPARARERRCGSTAGRLGPRDLPAVIVDRDEPELRWRDHRELARDDRPDRATGGDGFVDRQRDDAHRLDSRQLVELGPRARRRVGATRIDRRRALQRCIVVFGRVGSACRDDKRDRRD